jgi:hypothetical protein
MTDESEDSRGEDEDSEQEELRADIFPSKNGSKRAFQGPNPHSTGKFDEEETKRLAILVPGLTDADWGQSSKKPTKAAPDHDPNPLNHLMTTRQNLLNHPPIPCNQLLTISRESKPPIQPVCPLKARDRYKGWPNNLMLNSEFGGHFHPAAAKPGTTSSEMDKVGNLIGCNWMYIV